MSVEGLEPWARDQLKTVIERCSLRILGLWVERELLVNLD